MKTTPMMEQYMGFKKQYPDKVVLFRMGDFFETFGDDAKITSKALNITLTARDKSSDPTPLAGFPHHALKQYLPKLISAGHNVVIVDQIEDPKMAKGIVKRAVTRIVTPGTLDGEQASDIKNSYLAAFYAEKKDLAISLLDLATGELLYTTLPNNNESVSSILTGYDPVEALVLTGDKNIVVGNIPVQLLEKSFGNLQYSKEIIKEVFGVKNLQALGIEEDDIVANALAMTLKYTNETQRMKPEHIQTPMRFNFGGTMILDRATVRNLELVASAYSGEYRDSLLSVIDETKTVMGRRRLYSWILNPLVDKEQIDSRLSVVDAFFNSVDVLVKVRALLEQVNDIERIVGKIGLNRVNGRDLKALQISLEQIRELKKLIKGLKGVDMGIDTAQTKKIDQLIDLIHSSIAQAPPLTIMEGHVIKKGYSKEVDEIRSLTGDSKSWIKDFEEKERKRTGITSLKVSFNNVFGYYIDVTKTHQSKVPDDYIRKQTLVNSERYITEELKEKESIILGAEEKLFALEYRLFQGIRDKCLPYLELLQKVGKEVAVLDILAGFSHLAKTRNYVKPIVYDFGTKDGKIEIRNGRHPIVETISQDEFVSNDTSMNLKDSRMCVLTGPNMSGKSTYIRQVAVIVLMAQIGCFVPADKCEISLVDRIFTRVGASDDLSRGRSTFMVEMDEAANIVNNATKYSLVILDEIGRGTSTYDGVSIAWALAEHLTKEIKSRTLFATHYHELLKLSEKVGEGVRNFNVLVDEDQENGVVIFLRKIVEGGTDRSYGIYVAKMAGLPDKVIARANEILEGFEQESLFAGENELREGEVRVDTEKTSKKKKESALQIPLFQLGDGKIREELDQIDLDSLTPLEALNTIAKWKKDNK